MINSKCYKCKHNYKSNNYSEPKCNQMCANYSDFEPITNFERIKRMTIDEMAYYLVERWNCPDCSEHERLSDNPLLKGQICDMQCKKHCKEWLESEVEE